ncbi:MAG: hypothetical protein ACP59X_05745 [Solidesulfovibrio sp. DCME]|uniref:hypothetical protein n=1 Tax=Solidesulfovibrio sp. DCME TaxID=3447380 RepID=UPI003D0F26D8
MSALDPVKFHADVSLVEKQTNRLAFVHVRGNNSPRALRDSQLFLNAACMTMGHDRTSDEYVMGLNPNTRHMRHENLAAVMETGWAHGQFQQHVRGHRLVRQAEDNGNNARKVAFGLTYTFYARYRRPRRTRGGCGPPFFVPAAD